MVVNRKSTGRAMSMPGGILLGGMLALFWTLVCAALLGMLIDKEVLAETAVGYGSMFILVTGALLGSLMAYGKVKRQRAAVCAGAGAAYFLILLGMTALFFGGQYQAVGVTALLILAGSGTAILMGLRQGRRKPYGARKKLR